MQGLSNPDQTSIYKIVQTGPDGTQITVYVGQGLARNLRGRPNAVRGCDHGLIAYDLTRLPQNRSRDREFFNCDE